jgi:uncharacterized protein YbjT (DUF2867 family)
MANEKLTLVLGARGKTGRRVAGRLHARGVPLRLGSRAGAPPFDWSDERTWAPTLRGVHAAYVTYQPDLAVAGAAERVHAFSRLAVANGVRRLVLLSGRGEEGALLGEQAVRDAGAEWTVVRCAWFDQNFSEGFFLDQVLSGEVALPAADVKEPFVDVDDVADVAAAALLEDGHAGEVYELTGPRLLGFAEAVAEIAHACGREVRYVPVTVERYASMLAEYGVPPDLVSLVTYLFTEVLDGRNAHAAHGVQRALGRSPRDFGGYARAAAAAGVWGGPYCSV